MKKILTILLNVFSMSFLANAQVFQVDTIQYKGDVNKYINLVIMGDGYDSTEQNNFVADANNLTDFFFSYNPWAHYQNFFNVFAIEVISAESGIKHPNTATDCGAAFPSVPTADPNNYFGTSFDVIGIHRLVQPTNTTNIVNVLATNFPNYDQVVIIANAPYYGGSGYPYATTTTDSASPFILLHELGHSFAGLADEYWAFPSEAPNMTQETDPLLVRWKNWLGTGGVGIYQHCCGGQSASWYKPDTNCIMQYLSAPYCNVCSQAIVESIHELVNPIVNYSPSTSVINSSNQYLDFKLTELMKPVANTLNIKWELDAAIIANNIDSVQIDQNTLSSGDHSLVVTVVDTTELLRVDNHSTVHFNTVTWTIHKTGTGVELTSGANQITCSVYPNPTSGVLNIEFELENKSKVSIQLISTEGKTIQQIENKTMESGKHTNTIQIQHLEAGNYFLIFRIDHLVHTERIIKQ